MSSPSKPSRPPTALDSAERFLGRALILGVIVLAIAIGVGAWLNRGRGSAAPPAATPAAAAATNTLALVVDFGDGAQRAYPALPFNPGMSAVDALLAARTHPRALTVETSGAAETAFVSAIDGVRNEGSGDTARNWQFFVNADFGRRGAGATMLNPGDRVTWVFAVWQENPALPAFPPIKP